MMASTFPAALTRRTERGAIGDRLGRRLAARIAVDEGEVTFALDASEDVVVRGEPAFAMRGPSRDHRVRRKMRGDRAALRWDREFDVDVRRAKLPEGRVFRKARLNGAVAAQRGREPRFEQDLRAVADAQDQFALGGALADGRHQSIVRGDRARAHAIFVCEPARQHVRVEASHLVEIGVPVNSIGFEPDRATRANGLFFAIGPRKNENSDPRTHAGTPS